MSAIIQRWYNTGLFNSFWWPKLWFNQIILNVCDHFWWGSTDFKPVIQYISEACGKWFEDCSVKFPIWIGSLYLFQITNSNTGKLLLPKAVDLEQSVKGYRHGQMRDACFEIITLHNEYGEYLYQPQGKRDLRCRHGQLSIQVQWAWPGWRNREHFVNDSDVHISTKHSNCSVNYFFRSILCGLDV